MTINQQNGAYIAVSSLIDNLSDLQGRLNELADRIDAGDDNDDLDATLQRSHFRLLQKRRVLLVQLHEAIGKELESD